MTGDGTARTGRAARRAPRREPEPRPKTWARPARAQTSAAAVSAPTGSAAAPPATRPACPAACRDPSAPAQRRLLGCPPATPPSAPRRARRRVVAMALATATRGAAFTSGAPCAARARATAPRWKGRSSATAKGHAGWVARWCVPRSRAIRRPACAGRRAPTTANVRPASGAKTAAAASARTGSSARRARNVRPGIVSTGSVATPLATVPARSATWSASKGRARRRQPGIRTRNVRARIPRRAGPPAFVTDSVCARPTRWGPPAREDPVQETHATCRASATGWEAADPARRLSAVRSLV